jgi:DNA-binding GntR family transcriptional regulator
MIAEAAGNPLLSDSIQRLHAHLHIHRLYFPYAQSGDYFPYAQSGDTGEEHRRVAAAIRAGDPDGAEKAMRAHLAAARKRHLPAFG